MRGRFACVSNQGDARHAACTSCTEAALAGAGDCGRVLVTIGYGEAPYIWTLCGPVNKPFLFHLLNLVAFQGKTDRSRIGRSGEGTGARAGVRQGSRTVPIIILPMASPGPATLTLAQFGVRMSTNDKTYRSRIGRSGEGTGARAGVRQGSRTVSIIILPMACLRSRACNPYSCSVSGTTKSTNDKTDRSRIGRSGEGARAGVRQGSRTVKDPAR